MNNTRQPQLMTPPSHTLPHTMISKQCRAPLGPPKSQDQTIQIKLNLLSQSKAVKLFKQYIHSYNCYEVECVYPEFMKKYNEMLSEVKDFYSHASAQMVLDIIDNKTCKIMCVETAKDRENQAKCHNP